MSTLVALLILSFLIFFHELGHFLAARYFGVRVEVFSIGFGKALATYRHGDTLYQFAMIPLGGYVKMRGQNDLDPAQRDYHDDSYNTKKPWQRIIILLAGPFANFFIAFLLFAYIGLAGVQTLSPVIGNVSDNSPAMEAKLQKNDKIIEINQQPISSWKDLAEYIKDSQGSLEVIIERNGEYYRKTIEPYISTTENIFGETIQKRMIGIAPSGASHVVHYGPVDTLDFALEKTVDASTLILQSIQKLISGIVPVDQLGGVVSIVQITSKASQEGIIALFMFTALISVNLGVLNLLPIPALDGGHIMFNLYEMITRKIPSEEMVIKLTIIGWVILIGLMMLGLFNDLNRIFQ
jgi:regulator of sigma E protease